MDNDLKRIDSLDQICILYRVGDHIMDLKQDNIDDATRLKTAVASASL